MFLHRNIDRIIVCRYFDPDVGGKIRQPEEIKNKQIIRVEIANEIQMPKIYINVKNAPLKSKRYHD